MANRYMVALSLLVAGLLLKSPQSELQSFTTPHSALITSNSASNSARSPTPNLTPLPASDSAAQQPSMVQIDNCEGHQNPANFRQFPTLNPSAILGVVERGDSVQLKGRMMEVDGVLWYEAIAPALVPSDETAAQNYLEPGQVGWIASCFVQPERTL